LCHRAIAKEKLLKDRGGAGRKARLFPFYHILVRRRNDPILYCRLSQLLGLLQQSLFAIGDLPTSLVDLRYFFFVDTTSSHTGGFFLDLQK
jgi:hypothetical protein